MNIRFVSSLTPEDEDRIAPGVVNALSLLLDHLPLAYTLRIETAAGRVFQHAHAAEEPGARPASSTDEVFGSRPAMVASPRTPTS